MNYDELMDAKFLKGIVDEFKEKRIDIVANVIKNGKYICNKNVYLIDNTNRLGSSEELFSYIRRGLNVYDKIKCYDEATFITFSHQNRYFSVNLMRHPLKKNTDIDYNNVNLMKIILHEMQIAKPSIEFIGAHADAEYISIHLKDKSAIKIFYDILERLM